LRKGECRGKKMPTVNKDCQMSEDRLQQELEEASLKKRKLEEALKTVEATSKHRIDAAARQEIEAHKNRQQSPSSTPKETPSRSTDGNKS